MSDCATETATEALRQATRGTSFEGAVYAVGGSVRDEALGLTTASDDLDFVVEGDALELARFLWEQGVSSHAPVVYPRFGTAMVSIAGRDVELVTARVESYAPESRKPERVSPGSLLQDARRRDFTINTLLRNLHDGAVIDPLGMALRDLNQGIIRTPEEPNHTFSDDPLRMLRAVRFAARFGFAIEPHVFAAIEENANRIDIVSGERVRDELVKMLLTDRAADALEMLRRSQLLPRILPEAAQMYGVTQNAFHIYDVWTHTLVAVRSLPPDSSIHLRLATLLHDIGKPSTRSVDELGYVHFYHHAEEGARIARQLLRRLKFPNETVDYVASLVAEHMRIGDYSAVWSDAAVRRLMRDVAGRLDDLFALHAADVAGLSPEHQDMSRAAELRARMARVRSEVDIVALSSPLDGRAIMRRLHLPAGRAVGEVKDYLTNEVVEGRLAPDDPDTALRLAREFLEQRTDS